MNKGQYHSNKETVWRVSLLHGSIIDRVEERRVVLKRKDNTRFVRAQYGKMFEVNANNEYQVETPA